MSQAIHKANAPKLTDSFHLRSHFFEFLELCSVRGRQCAMHGQNMRTWKKSFCMTGAAL